MIVIQKFRGFAVLAAIVTTLLLLYSTKTQWRYIGNDPGSSASTTSYYNFFRADQFKDYILNHPDRARYASVDTWRTPDTYEATYIKSNQRPELPHINNFRSKGEYLKQPIIGDYPKGSQNVFFMVKTGASVLWHRLPIHLLTSLTKTPKFGLYSDSPGSVAGYEVVDALANLTEETKNDPTFTMYRYQKVLHDEHGVSDSGHVAFNDGWNLDRYKNIPMLAHAYAASPQSDWFVFMDADSYMLMDNLMDLLDSMNPEQPIYYGARNVINGQKSNGEKYEFPFAHGGSGVIISRNALELTVGEHPEYVEEYERKTAEYCCGDVMVALMFKEKLNLEVMSDQRSPRSGIRVQGEPFYSVKVRPDKWCTPIVTFHHMTPHDIEILYEYERLRPYDRNITYGHIYRDFYLPYISEKIADWDNRADEVTFSRDKDVAEGVTPQAEGGTSIRPYESFEACQQACQQQESCLQFRLLAEGNKCGLSRDIRLGKPAASWVDQDRDSHLITEGTTSGWMIDRIRELRKAQPCDPLYYDGQPDKELTEGWYRREQENI